MSTTRAGTFRNLAWLVLAFPATAQAPALPDGVTPEIAAMIERGLQYLARTQNREGSWRSQGGQGGYPVAMTALAGMAMLGSGSTPTRGRYWRNVRRATDFLVHQAQPSGLITSPQEEGQSMYGHGFATMFLAQVLGMEEDGKRHERLHQVLTDAVKLTARAQSREGGWIYQPNSGGDEGSVTVTQMQALRACRNAGIVVPIATVNKAVSYISRSANADGSIRYSLRGHGGGRPPITAAAVAVLYSAGRYDDPIAAKALVYAKKHLPVGSSNGHYFYAQLYLAQALYFEGGRDWDDYYARIAGRLSQLQQNDGSWVGDNVGTTYGTALALTILQLPYAFVPIYQR